MAAIEKWIDRVYAETDFGRSVATSIAGIIGLITYLFSKDWAIAAFSFIISFPIIRLISKGLHDKFNRNKKRKIEQEDAEYLHNSLSKEEKKVVQAFINAGECVPRWSQINKLSLSGASIESLIERNLMSTSMTADSLSEAFVLDSTIFDIANKKSKKL